MWCLAHTIQYLEKLDIREKMLDSKRVKHQVLIDYKKLRQINPEAARTAVLSFLASNNRNIAKTAKAFGLQRVVVYDIIRKSKQGNLKDRSKAPKRVHNRTVHDIVEVIIKAKNTTKFGPKRLFSYLQLRYGLFVAYGTIRSILRRNEHRII